MKDYMSEYKFWCENPAFDEETRKELLSLTDEKEIEDRFYRELEFGTAGLRGVIGAGANRMNFYTVRRATQGLANFILKEGTQDMGVAIAFDSRNMSVEFSREVALCLNANGIKTYRFDTLRPTPELSFAVRYLGCTAGIVITASHNPAEYNGYKVYWADGAQITAPKDKLIIEEVGKVKDFVSAKTMSLEEATAKGLYNVIGEEVDNAYIAELQKQVKDPEALKKYAKDITVVYTPLHGTGNLPVRRILKEIGFDKVHIVKEQEAPDGNFPTLVKPNPEDPKAFKLALDLANKVDADLILATDPDADRLGVYAKNSKTGEYMKYTGNMSALLIAEYELEQLKAQGKLDGNGAFISTIVSSNMAFSIAKEYGLKSFEVLTGFKYIGEKIHQFETARKENGGKYDAAKGAYRYTFGFEESYGCLIGTHARDKDAIVAVMALCEAAAYYKTKNLTLWDQMLNIWEKYGYFVEDTTTLTFKGIEGGQKIKAIMENMRNCPPSEVGGLKVLSTRDYLKDVKIDMITGEKTTTGLPSSNVLYFELENDAWCCVRPSGTEPTIKFYIGVKTDSLEASNKLIEKLSASLSNYAN